MRRNYITELEKQFKQYINLDIRKMGRLNALHEAMLNHYKSVPKFSRTTTKFVCGSVIKYRKLIEKEIWDYKDFFFNQITFLGKDYNDVLSVITKSKKDLEIAKNKLINSLIIETKNIFKLDDGAILEQLVDLINCRWKTRIEESLSFLTTKFIDILTKLDKVIDDVGLIKQLGLLLTGFEIDYWSDNQVSEFLNSIEAICEELNQPTKEFKDTDKSIKSF